MDAIQKPFGTPINMPLKTPFGMLLETQLRTWETLFGALSERNSRRIRDVIEGTILEAIWVSIQNAIQDTIKDAILGAILDAIWNAIWDTIEALSKPKIR